tara:strand:- start:62 stop:202 length:141 start_codon:yes stop_codon:yes gene_type:complete
MPMVGGKKYAYTPAGMKAANAAAKRQGKKVAKTTKPKRGTTKTRYA